MKQGKLNEKEVEWTSYEEEEQLNIDELMDVQGGQEDLSKNCGLGCYLSGLSHTSQDQKEHDSSR